MQSYISIKNINLEFSSKELFRDVSFSINKGEKIGVIGPNGSGKTTLLKILDGNVKPNSSLIQKSGKNFYVPQLDNKIAKSDQPLWEYLQGYVPEWWSVLENLENIFDWNDIDINQSLKTFSGGELAKILLCLGISISPDILLLDEPTNHLDLPAIEKLIKFLNSWKKSLVVISHNIYFLNSVVNKIAFINKSQVKIYGGNYDDFKKQINFETEAQLEDYSAELKKKKSIEESIRKEQKRASDSQRVGKNLRGDRSMANIEKGFFANRASRVAGKNRENLEKLQKETEENLENLKMKKSRKVYLDLNKGNIEKGRLLFRIKNGILKIENKELLGIDDFSMYSGDRIAILGANGTGKTLLVKNILSLIESDAIKLEGEIEKSFEMNPIYLSQKYEIVNPNLSLVENIQNVNAGINNETVRKILGNFLFKNDLEIIKNASVLSGGETARLAMAMITASPVDLIVLDEPTNNLDIETIEAIEDSLKEFSGGLLTITHDLDFLKEIGTEKVFVVKNNELFEFPFSPKDLSFEKELKNFLS